MERIPFSYDHLHPKARERFRLLGMKLTDLYQSGLVLTDFRPFEGYRSVERQRQLFGQRPAVTKADAWQSAHNYGLAVDFVPWVDGKWTWLPADHPDWRILRQQAELRGLDNSLDWDRPHVEDFLWSQVKRHLI